MESSFTHNVTFGDCDPAGIVFYPNIFRWMDAAFHSRLRDAGGHAEICERLDSVGLGLAEATAKFRAPMRDGDELVIHLNVTRWGTKSVTLAYEGRVADRITFTGQEVRCVFAQSDQGLSAKDISGLKAILESGDG